MRLSLREALPPEFTLKGLDLVTWGTESTGTTKLVLVGHSRDLFH